MDEINAINEQPTSAPLAPTPNMVSGPVSYFLDISRGPAGVVLMGGTDADADGGIIDDPSRHGVEM